MPPHSDDVRRPFSDHLRDYIEEQEKSPTGVSLRMLIEKCVDPETGQSLNRTWLTEASAGRTKKIPEPWRLRALSRGIGTPVAVLQRLAAEQWANVQADALHVPVGEEDWVLVPIPAGLSEVEKQKVVRWAQRYAEDLTEEG